MVAGRCTSTPAAPLSPQAGLSWPPLSLREARPFSWSATRAGYADCWRRAGHRTLLKADNPGCRRPIRRHARLSKHAISRASRFEFLVGCCKLVEHVGRRWLRTTKDESAIRVALYQGQRNRVENKYHPTTPPIVQPRIDKIRRSPMTGPSGRSTTVLRKSSKGKAVARKKG